MIGKWLDTQLPEHLRGSFNSTPALNKASGAKLKEIGPSGLENTWVLSLADKDELLEEPWLWNIITLLAINYPNPVPWKVLGFKTENQIQQFTQKHIKRWVEDKHLITTSEGLSIALPYCHINQTSEDWVPVRMNNFMLAAEGLLSGLSPTAIASNKAHRVVLNRSLSDAQLEEWVKRLKQLEQDFFASHSTASKATDIKTETHTVLMAIGKRSLADIKK